MSSGFVSEFGEFGPPAPISDVEPFKIVPWNSEEKT